MALKTHRMSRENNAQNAQCAQLRDTFLSWDLQDFLASIAEFSSEVRA